MHKGTLPIPLPMLLKILKNPKQANPCPVTSTTKALAIFQLPMKQKGCFISTFVHFVLQKGEKILHMLKLNVEVKTSMQKTIKAGRGSPFQ